MSISPHLASDPGPFLFLFYIPYLLGLSLILGAIGQAWEKKPGGRILLALGVLVLGLCEYGIGIFTNWLVEFFQA